MHVHLVEYPTLLQIPLRFDPYIYFTSKHLFTQTSKKIYCFFLFRNNEIGAAAVFQCISQTDKNWTSPARAPFGGIQCDELCTTNEISFLLECIELWISQCDGNKLSIKTAPSCYNLTTSKLLSDCYLLYGYSVEKHVNHSINITPSSYINCISPPEKRRLKKCRSAGFISGICTDSSPEIIYNFLNSCRLEKGYNLSLNHFQLEELLISFPNEVTIFTVTDQTIIIALAVTIHVNNAVLYHFLSSSLSSYSNFSPAVMLNEEIYNFCQNKKITILDLGISLDHHGIEKENLIRFKENIGGIKSYKATYEKLLK